MFTPIKKTSIGVGIFLLFALAACGKKEPTPTPEITPSVTVSSNVMLLQVAELAADPEAYEKQRVQTTGRYSVLPTPACDAELFLSPSTWVLSDAGVFVRAGGLEPILNPLAQDEMTLQVEGRWQRWEGLVGCGQAAVESTIWYLQAERIISPNPLSRATLTPSTGISGTTGVTVTSTAPTLIAPTLASPLASPTSLPVITATRRPLPSPTITPSRVSPSPTSSPRPTSTPRATSTAASSPVATPTASPTSLTSPLGTPTDTPWPTFTPLPGGTASPSPTATPSGDTEEIGTLIFDRVANAKLDIGKIHRWLFDGFSGDVITVTVGPSEDMDLEITILGPQGDKLARRDDQAAGKAETIGGLALTVDGEYKVQVKEVDDTGGDYGLVLMDQLSSPYTFLGTLVYNDSVSEHLSKEGIHIWFFQGEIGDDISITLEPDGASDGVLRLYGPGGVGDPIRQVDDTDEGGMENYQHLLIETGLYSIWVSEFSGLEGDYQLSITEV